MRLIDADKIDFNEVFKGQSDFARDAREAAQSLLDRQPDIGSWIPVSERLPEKSEYKGTSESWHLYMKRLEVAHMTDTIEYTFAYFDGCKWMDKKHQKIENVMAWKVHEPYKQVRSGCWSGRRGIDV